MGLLKQFTTNFSKVMRKHVFLSMLGMAALFLVNGCQKPTMDPPYLTLVGESEFTIDANGGPGSVEYRVTNPVQGASVSLSTDPAEVDWVTGLAAASGAVTFNVEVNTAMEERSAKVILSYPQAAETVEFTIKQAAAGKPVIKLASTTLSVTSAGGPTTVTYDVTNALEGLTLTVANAPEWITDLEVGEEEISFNVTENTTGDTRSAELTVSYPNADDVKLTVQQFGGGDYVVNPNWTVEYAGKGRAEDGSVLDVLNVTVSSGSDGYMVGVISVDGFNEMGIETFVEEMVAQYQAQLDYYAQMGYPLTWADVLYTSTKEGLGFDPLDSSVEWYGIAFGVTADGIPSGLYALSEPFTPEELEASDAYNKWIGAWRIEDAAGVGYDITISALNPDINYNMVGWQADAIQDMPLTVNFDSATGELIFVTNYIGQQPDGTEVGFYGAGSDDYVYSGDYDIAYATLSADGNTATVNGESFEGELGPAVYVQMQLFGFASDGLYVYSDQETVPEAFPLTMTKSSASAGASAKSTGLKPVGMKINRSVNYEVPFARLCETNSLAVKRLAR